MAEAPPADDYDFANYPQPPPVGTTPHAQTAATDQSSLSDHSAYCTLAPHGPHTNDTADHALQMLQQDAIFFVFGHGGDVYNGAFRQFATFWDAAAHHWSFFVQTTAGRDKILADFVAGNAGYAPDVEVLDNLPANSLNRVLLAVYEGCRTGYWNQTWGSPVRGTVNKAARCAVGFTTDIYSDAYVPDGKGAETWADWFWDQLAHQGKTVAYLKSIMIQQFSGASGLLSVIAEGRDATPGNFMITPARYGNGTP